jgi:hypothetical protein
VQRSKDVPRRPYRSIAVGVTIGAITLVAGCGDGDSGAAQLSPQEYRSQADAICTKYDVKQRVLPDPTADFGAYFGRALPLAKAQVTELAALTAPDDLTATHDAFIAVQKEQIAVVTTASAQIATGEDGAAVLSDLSAKFGPLRERLDARADELGLKTCGSGLATSAARIDAADASPSSEVEA